MDNPWLLGLLIPILLFLAVAFLRGVGHMNRWIAELIAVAVVAKIGDQIEVRWNESIDTALKPVRAELVEIRDEVTVNGGQSLKDRVIQLQKQVEDLHIGGMT